LIGGEQKEHSAETSFSHAVFIVCSRLKKDIKKGYMLSPLQILGLVWRIFSGMIDFPVIPCKFF
jgi:hypothetical protein